MDESPATEVSPADKARIEIDAETGYASEWAQGLVTGDADDADIADILPLGFVEESGAPPDVHGPSVSGIHDGVLFVGADGFGVRDALVTLAIGCMYRDLPVTFVASGQAHRTLADTIPAQFNDDTAVVDLSALAPMPARDAVADYTHQVFRVPDTEPADDLFTLLEEMVEDDDYRDERVVILSGVNQLAHREADWDAIQTAVTADTLGVVLWSERPVRLTDHAHDAVSTCTEFCIFNPGTATGAEWVEDWFDFGGGSDAFFELGQRQCFGVFTHGFAGRLELLPPLPPRDRTMRVD